MLWDIKKIIRNIEVGFSSLKWDLCDQPANVACEGDQETLYKLQRKRICKWICFGNVSILFLRMLLEFWLHHVCLIIWFISCYYDCCINWVISNSKVFSVTREAGRLTGFSVEGIIILSFMFTVYDLLFLVEFLLAQSLWIMSWSDKSGDHLAWTLGNHYSLFVDNILSIS